MMVFSAPVGDAGVVSAAVAIDDIMSFVSQDTVGSRTADAYYYSITDVKRPLVAGSDTKAKETDVLFSKINCTASTIGAPFF
jgi:hypothetical protein